jgi:parallel beta-helix repeat protein
MNHFARTLLLLSLACALAIPALAAEGRQPVWVPGTIIGADGHYILTRNVIGAGGPVSDIAASRVTLDLNGFTVENAGGAGPVIVISGPVVEVTIRNGKIFGGTESIFRPLGPVARTVVIEDIQSKGAAADAIRIEEVRNVEIRRVNVIDAFGNGIAVTGFGTFKNGHIEHNSIHLTGGDGILVEHSSAMSVRHNRIEVPTGSGIHFVDSVACLAGENQISDADAIGLWLEFSRGCKVYNNVINRGEKTGMLVDPGSEDNLILDNVVRESGLGGAPAHPGLGGAGMHIDGSRNHIEGNTINFNDGCGLYIGGIDNTFGRNMARGNDVPPVFFCGGACVGLFPSDSCDVSGVNNTSFGDNFIPFLF